MSRIGNPGKPFNVLAYNQQKIDRERTMIGERKNRRRQMDQDEIRRTAAAIAKKNPTANMYDSYRIHVVPYAGSFDWWQTGWRAGVMAAHSRIKEIIAPKDQSDRSSCASRQPQPD